MNLIHKKNCYFFNSVKCFFWFQLLWSRVMCFDYFMIKYVYLGFVWNGRGASIWFSLVSAFMIASSAQDYLQRWYVLFLHKNIWFDFSAIFVILMPCILSINTWWGYWFCFRQWHDDTNRSSRTFNWYACFINLWLLIFSKS